MKLRFEKNKLLEAIKHCRSGEPKPLYGKKTGAGLWLVGDEGIYLMSNGSSPGWPVVYAEECNPKTLDFETWWSVKRRSFGGDDGVEFISAEAVESILIACDSHLVINLTPRNYQLLSDRKKAKQ
ncbi:MAG: hypothetical protein C0402_05285 [Thermodesulfovibrio sp.]|nr:hypothetical protein [Thermodesulfovibrio sp.]